METRKDLRWRLRQPIHLPVRAQHAGDRLPSRLSGGDARHALDDARLFHEGRVEFGRDCYIVKMSLAILACPSILDCLSPEI